MSRHQMVNPGQMPEPRGFSYGAVAGDGRPLYLAGMVGVNPDGTISPDIVEQYELACRAMTLVIEEAGGRSDDLVSLIVYTTDLDAYRANLGPIGEAHRRVFGRHYPPIALIGVARLFEPEFMVELVGTAIVPDLNRRG